MNPFFASQEAASRYDTFRPKVHRIVIDWLGKHCAAERWRHGLDVACGTGDSTLPLLDVCDDVLGIDVSEEMLSFAREKGLKTLHTSYDAIPLRETFDLISTCMAFHWFDPARAIACYKALSCGESTWIIYNFAFAGHSTNDDFNAWFRGRYLASFPSPPRNQTASVVPRDDPAITCLGEGRGSLPIDFSPERLVGYLSTQSNVEHAVRNGADYARICESLLSEVRAINPAGPYQYAFSYEIHRYRAPGGARG